MSFCFFSLQWLSNSPTNFFIIVRLRNCNCQFFNPSSSLFFFFLFPWKILTWFDPVFCRTTSLLIQALSSMVWKLSRIHYHIWELIIISCYLIFLNIFYGLKGIVLDSNTSSNFYITFLQGVLVLYNALLTTALSGHRRLIWFFSVGFF